MESNTTYLFDVSEIDDVLVEETIKEVYEALEEKGYNDSRKKICKLERTQIVEVLLRNYMK